MNDNINEASGLTRGELLRNLGLLFVGAAGASALVGCNNAQTDGAGSGSASATQASENVSPEVEESSLFFDAEQLPPAAKRVAFLSGSWSDMGRQYSQQYPDSTARLLASGMFTEEDFSWYEEHTPEVADLFSGMAEGLGVSVEDLYPLGVPVESGHSCSSSAAWGSQTADGRLLVASNHDTLAVADYYDPILVAWPEDGHPFMVSSGVQGAVSMNDQGLVLTGSSGQNAADGDVAVGLPAMLDYPVLAARAANVEEARELYRTYTGCYSSNYNMNDVNGGHLVLEQSNAHNAERVPGDFGEVDYLITTNDFMTDEMQSSILPAGSGYDDCRPRYYTERHVILAAGGNATLDTMADAMSVDNGYYDENDEWHDVSWDDSDYGLYSPENVSPWFQCFEKTLADPTNGTMYVMNGCRNTLMSWVPEGTGNFCRVTLGETPEEVTESARNDANFLIYDAGAEVSAATGDDRTAREDKLNVAKAAYVEGENLYASVYEATDDEGRFAALAKACSAYLKAQCYAQLAMDVPTQVIRPLLGND